MPVLQEPLNLGDLLKYEAPNLYSRERVTVAAGQSLPLGAVVGMVTATARSSRSTRPRPTEASTPLAC